jgi:GntR family transcriptional repressor for pyruvate dehydrogenase complex
MRRRPESASLTIDTLVRRKNLVTTLVEAVEKEIAEGRLKPGDRLPPETALAASAGVSRTVVREAVAALKAANLVETRQGAGAFVLSPMARLNIPGGVRRATVEEILAILELRLAVEVESAALAAARRTDADIAAMDKAIEAMGEEAIAAGEAVEPDLAFHRALAAATKNRYFKEFLDNLGELAIPRRHLARAAIDTSDLRPHFARVRAEHQAIRNAVLARDSALAAAAMRAHLAGSRARYAELIKTGEN